MGGVGRKRKQVSGATTTAAASSASSSAPSAPATAAAATPSKKQRKSTTKPTTHHADTNDTTAPSSNAFDLNDPTSCMDHLSALEGSLSNGADEAADDEPPSIAASFNTLVQIIRLAQQLAGMPDTANDRTGIDRNGAHLAELNPERVAVAVAAVQACVRIYTMWLETGQFRPNGGSTSKKKKKGPASTSAALHALETLLAQQYKKVWSILLFLIQSDLDPVQVSVSHAGMDLIQAEGVSIAMSALESGKDTKVALDSVAASFLAPNSSFSTLLYCIFLSPLVSTECVREFQHAFLDSYADLRSIGWKIMRSLVHGKSAAEYEAECAKWTSRKSDAGVGAKRIIEYLLATSREKELKDRWVQLPADITGGMEEDGFGDEDMFALPSSANGASKPEALRRLFGDIWLGVLRQRLPDAETYKDVLAALHSTIMPAMHSPMLLADFLTDSYNIGGVVSLLALNGLFILISKYNLDYPSFFKKLYACCQPLMFHAKYRARFFQLVALFLTSSYLPSTLVCAFVKRFARLSLSAPPSGSIFCIAVIYNLLRRHPVCRPLLNRALANKSDEEQLAVSDSVTGEKEPSTNQPTPASSSSKRPVGASLLSSLSSLLAARSAAVASGVLTSNDAADEEDDDEDDSEENEQDGSDVKPKRAEIPRFVPPAPERDLRQGTDPFIEEEEDPERSRANESSLWEIKTLANHFSPTVSNLAKVFFSTHAPKKDLDINKYIEQSYDTLFTKETSRRVNQRVTLNLPLSSETRLFADANQSIGLTFALPTTTKTEEK